MFGNKNKDNIDIVLEEGRSWVGRLENAVEVTVVKAEEIDQEIFDLTTKRNILDASIKEGETVASNFKNMLGMK